MTPHISANNLLGDKSMAEKIHSHANLLFPLTILNSQLTFLSHTSPPPLTLPHPLRGNTGHEPDERGRGRCRIDGVTVTPLSDEPP